jgi:hypothetical protein
VGRKIEALCTALLVNVNASQVLVAHAYNPSYSGGKDQRIADGSQQRQIVRETLPPKTHHRKGLVEWLKV